VARDLIEQLKADPNISILDYRIRFENALQARSKVLVRQYGLSNRES
jgi:hypothetical protein